jgi:DNA mismatch repair protein MutL
MYQQSNSHRIHILPEHIIDQIKAGEVIERPSTLLKELLENSIDAQATKIEIEIINNGMELLVVKDNGIGMPKEDMELAFLRHATSKIENFEDIYRLTSYGFRGEALASMASISKITCVSNEKGSPESTIKINGSIVESQHTEKKPLESSKTEIYIKDLFFNTPARMKFVKSQTAERNQLKKIINAFLLSHPAITFSIRFDDKAKKQFKATNHLDRIKEVTQKSFEKLNYIEIKNEYDGIQLHLFLGVESSRGTQGKSQYILVNHRMIQNMQIHKIITNCSTPIWGEGSGNYVLFINLPSDQLDVNVHPNKTVIKFFETHKIHSLISSSIKNELKQTKTNESTQEQEELVPHNPTFTDKNLNYNTSQIETETGLNQYFSNLDQREDIGPTFSHWELIKKFERLSIYSFQKNLYFLNHLKVIKFDLKRLFENALNLSSIPLLISQPIRSKKFNHKLISELQKVGFEIDLMDKKVFILRSYPESFKYYQLNHLLEALCDTGKFTILEAINSLEVEQSKLIAANFYSQFLNSMGLSKLISLGLLTEINQEMLINEK